MSTFWGQVALVVNTFVSALLCRLGMASKQQTPHRGGEVRDAEEMKSNSTAEGE